MKKMLLLLGAFFSLLAQAQTNPGIPPNPPVQAISPGNLAKEIANQIKAKAEEMQALAEQLKLYRSQLEELKKQQALLQKQIAELEKKKPGLSSAESKQLEQLQKNLGELNKKIAELEVSIYSILEKTDAVEKEIEKLKQKQVAAEREAAAAQFARLKHLIQKDSSFLTILSTREKKMLGFYENLYKTDSGFRKKADEQKSVLQQQQQQEVLNKAIEDRKDKSDEARESFKAALKMITEHYEKESGARNKVLN